MRSVMLFNACRQGICRQSSQISQQSVIGKAYPEGGLSSKVCVYIIYTVGGVNSGIRVLTRTFFGVRRYSGPFFDLMLATS